MVKKTDRSELHEKFDTASREGNATLADVIAHEGDALAEMLVEDRASLARVLAAASTHVLSGRRASDDEALLLARALVANPEVLSDLLIESP